MIWGLIAMFQQWIKSNYNVFLEDERLLVLKLLFTSFRMYENNLLGNIKKINNIKSVDINC